MKRHRSAYPIAVASLREQVRDRYRTSLIGGLALLCVALVVSAQVMHWSGLVVAMAEGALIGMLPSLVAGQPARMPLAPGDGARIERWLERKRYRRDIRGWVPAVPRALYFDSQIVAVDKGVVTGPVITLRTLRRHLEQGSGLSG